MDAKKEGQSISYRGQKKRKSRPPRVGKKQKTTSAKKSDDSDEESENSGDDGSSSSESQAPPVRDAVTSYPFAKWENNSCALDAVWSVLAVVFADVCEKNPALLTEGTVQNLSLKIHLFFTKTWIEKNLRMII